MQVKVATWNMRHSKNGWDFLDNGIAPDIALVQEAVPLPGRRGETGIWGGEIGATRKWGSGVFTKTIPLRLKEFSNLHPGALVAADAMLPDGSTLTLISLYGLLENTYSITTLHRMLSDLTPLLDVSRKRVILAGDFNASLQWDAQPGGTRSHWILFERLKDFGMVDCLEQCQKDHLPIQTWRSSRKPNIPWQLDYIFASKSVAKHLVSCDVVNNPSPYDFSDHNPVVAVFDL
jgi:hypothetical protein